MEHITRIPRNQMYFSPEASGLEDTISSENPIPFIDAFVAALSLKVGFFGSNDQIRRSSQFLY